MAAASSFQYLLGLGSNLGDRRTFIASALNALERRGTKVLGVSKLHETKPIGVANCDFLNGAAVVLSQKDPEEFLREILSIEQELGRIRERRWDNRTIDCDILLAETAEGKPIIWKSETLTIPHPEMLHRDFVLVPAREVAGDWIFPGSGRSLEDLSRDLPRVLEEMR